MRRWLALVAAVLGVAAPPGSQASPLSAHKAPQWWNDAKFGIFVHWGPYSVPAWGPVTQVDTATNFTTYAEWYEETMSIPGTATWQHHLLTYGPDVGYDDFFGMWKAQRWDPDAWIALFEQARAKYFVLTAKHSDGFALWCSRTSRRDACDMGPRRNLVKDLMDASHRAKDKVRPGLYYSVPEWQTPAPKPTGMYTQKSKWAPEDQVAFAVAYESPLPRRNPYTQVPIPYSGYVPIDDYATGQVTPQVHELIDEFRPAVLWCDIGGLESYLRADAWIADYYAAVPDGVVNDRCGDTSTHADYATVERPSDVGRPPFEVTQGMAGLGSSFGLNAALPDSAYQTTDQLVMTLVDTVAAGGNLLLDIGPRADGTIPNVMVDRLKGIGAWLDTNGEAIFGSERWSTQRAGETRFTQGASGFVYALLASSSGDTVRLDARGLASDRVALLGDDALPLPTHRDGAQLVVTVPAQTHPFVLRIGGRLTPRLTATRAGNQLRGTLKLPHGVTRAMGCRGVVSAGGRRAALDGRCRYAIRGTRATRARFGGNPVLTPRAASATRPSRRGTPRGTGPA